MKVNRSANSGGVKAPPQRAKLHMMPCARTRSCGGSHVVNAFVRFGKQPASPAPNRNRVTAIDVKFHIQPVAAVKNDHQSTMRNSTRRGPIQSPIHPPGISKIAYAKANAVKIAPISVFDNPRSLVIAGAACEIATRSM